MSDTRHGLYGHPPADLAPHPADAVQTSPLVPGSESLETQQGRFDTFAMLAPPGTLERRTALALALTSLKADGRLTALAPKTKGGSRIARELEELGCRVEETSQSHHRICFATKPASDAALKTAIEAGAPRFMKELGLWSQPGVFSWDRLDPGSQQLVRLLPALSGKGADFGCGLGYLAHGVLGSAAVQSLALIDIDRRAIDAARRNVGDPRVSFHWADVTRMPLADLNFVVMNPPFHDAGIEDKNLGKRFIQKAADSLRKGSSLWLVANRHLPYEETLRSLLRRVELRGDQDGFKVYEAVK